MKVEEDNNMSDYLKYQEISNQINNKKQKESDRLISALAEMLLFDENNQEEPDEIMGGENEANFTFEHKVAMLSLCCLRVSVNHQLIGKRNYQYHNQLKDDMDEIIESMKWLEGYFEINDILISDIIDLLGIIGDVPEESAVRYIGYANRKCEKVLSGDFLELLNIICNFFFLEGMEDVSYHVIENMLKLSRERNTLEEHREVVVKSLAQWGESIPEWGYSICVSEASNFFPAEDISCSDFLWFYGCVTEKLGDFNRAKTLFRDSYNLRRKLYGEENWYTLVTKREYDFVVWLNEKNEEAFQGMIEFVEKVETYNYLEVEKENIEITEGKTLYVILLGMEDTENLEEYNYYLGLYEKICDKYNDIMEPLLKRRLSLNLRGGYYLKTGDYILAEETFLDALEQESQENTDEILSEVQIKSNLLLIYYMENDFEHAWPILTELLDILEEDTEYVKISGKDEYRIYTIMVSLEAQSMMEIDEDEIMGLKDILHNSCIDILENPEQLNDYASEMTAFMICAITLLLQNGCVLKEEQEEYLKALAQIEIREDIFRLNKNQQTLLYYMLALLSWELDKQETEYYFRESIRQFEKNNMPITTKASILEMAAAYYGKSNRYDIGRVFMEQALNEITALWQSYVRYLNDIRLLQILAPTQILFTTCYSVIREHESMESSYEKVLCYKALASLAGKERNRIMNSGYINRELVSRIQRQQNKLALLETENIFRENMSEFLAEEVELRRLEAEFSERFPKDAIFKEIELEEVKQKIPDNSVVIEYFTCTMVYGLKQDVIKTDEGQHVGIDVYVVRKKNGSCDLHKITISEGMKIQEMAQEFIGILQDESRQSASIDQMNRFEKLRFSLYQALIQPIYYLFDDMDVIYIAPDNNLINLPFGILSGEGKMLGEEYSIVEIECARDFLYDIGSNYATSNETLIIGNPAYDVRNIDQEIGKNEELHRAMDIALADIRNLPFTELEIRSVSKKTGNCYYSGEEASKNRFLEADKFKNIHIATHGYFDLQEETDSLYSSSLMFAGVKNWIHTGRLSKKYGNGIVTADEVSRMDLHATELVVLSSCLNGMNEVFYNKGFHGMVGALSAAGVRFVISHLWNADDFSTAVFMDAFYEQYVNKKELPFEALGKAKQYLKNVTVGELRKQGWFEVSNIFEKETEAAKLLERYKAYNDRVKPFKNERFWGGFVCFQCN